ncbi:PTS galactosamine/N-acetylgalactosamine transporter subunit IIA [Anaerorhabdus sp.]|jgi:N-acetylgalactosamine PTS system EIIA component|uniref:PTS galactosamine/N-acetylgalactosamine transporter subunit IIA n=1 Tax=Anaerorhabdus sp. TaxID=1872524 RepID=UPI002FC6B899
MIGIIITGHGNFATGLSSSVKLIAGQPENYEAVDFVQEDSVEDLERNLNNAIEKLAGCSGIMMFTDLVGGSPFKTSVEISMKRKEKIVVLGGTNLGMIVESSMARGFMEDVDALADMIVNTGKDQVIKYTYVERVEEVVDGDGI